MSNFYASNFLLTELVSSDIIKKITSEENIMFEFFYTFDLSLAEFANAICRNAGVFCTPVFKGITYLGDMAWAFLLTALIMLVFRRTRKAGAAAIVAIVLGAICTNLIMKDAVARLRPYADESSPFYAFWQDAGSMTESEYSFPSGHATASAAFAVAMFLCFRKRTSWLYLFVPVVIGFTRIYFQVHFASDVLFGFLIGAVCGVAAWFIVKLLRKWSFFERCLNFDLIGKLIKKTPSEEPAEDGNDEE